MVAMVVVDLSSRSSVNERAELLQPDFLRDGSMLVGWGAALPGVARTAKPHVHEFGAYVRELVRAFGRA